MESAKKKIKNKKEKKAVKASVPQTVIIDDSERSHALPIVKRRRSPTNKKKKKATAKSKSTKNKLEKAQPYQRKYPKVTAVNVAEIRTLVELERMKTSLNPIKYAHEYDSMVLKFMSDGGEINDFADLLRCHYSTIHTWVATRPTFGDALVDGQLYFIASLRQKLIDWMNDGHSFESFGSVAGRERNWLYELAKHDPLFGRAKEIGTVKSMAMWENLLKAQTAGSLSRLKSSKPILKRNGDPVIDQNGDAMYHKEYVPAMGSDRALQFAMRARFSYYRPEEKITDSDTKAELDEALAEMNKQEDDEREKLKDDK